VPCVVLWFVEWAVVEVEGEVGVTMLDVDAQCPFVPSGDNETSAGPTLKPALMSVEKKIIGNPLHFTSNSAEGA